MAPARAGPRAHLDQARGGVPPLLKVLLPVLLLDLQGKAGPQNALQAVGVRRCPWDPSSLHSPGLLGVHPPTHTSPSPPRGRAAGERWARAKGVSAYTSAAGSTLNAWAPRVTVLPQPVHTAAGPAGKAPETATPPPRPAARGQ